MVLLFYKNFIFFYSIINIIWSFDEHYVDSIDHFLKYNNFNIINNVFQRLTGNNFYKSNLSTSENKILKISTEINEIEITE